jgi:DNA-binding transcriptional regulator YiaG
MNDKGEKMTREEIKQLLEDLQWSEEKLADATGVTVFAVHKWLAGKNHPSRLRARKLRAIRDKRLGKKATA